MKEMRKIKSNLESINWSVYNSNEVISLVDKLKSYLYDTAFENDIEKEVVCHNPGYINKLNEMVERKQILLERINSVNMSLFSTSHLNQITNEVMQYYKDLEELKVEVTYRDIGTVG